MQLTIAGPAGELEALLDEPAPGFDPTHPHAAVAVAHPHPGYGGTMHTKVVYHAAKALSRIGCAALRFNFRGVGRSAGVFDEGRGEKDDFRAAVDFLTARYPECPEVWAAGMSFGAYIALNEGSHDERVSALIGISTAVTGYDYSAVISSGKPIFLIHGERDEVAPLGMIRRVYSMFHEPKELVIIDAAGHLFDGKVGDVADAIEDLLADFPAGSLPAPNGTR